MALGATGTDTGGSIRQPRRSAALPRQTRVTVDCSRFGDDRLRSSLDQAGPMAANLEDCALLLQSMAPFCDPHDSTSAQRDVPVYARRIKSRREGAARRYPQRIIAPTHCHGNPDALGPGNRMAA